MNAESPVKSVIINGKINNPITYKLFPSTEFSEGVWNISLVSISYTCATSDVEELCSVSCNMVKSQKLKDDSYTVESYEQPFGVFLLSSSKIRNTITFGKS